MAKARSKDIASKLDDLAHKIIETATAPETTFEERLAAFKLLTGYYIGTSKVPKPESLDPDSNSFAGFRKHLDKAEMDFDIV